MKSSVTILAFILLNAGALSAARMVVFGDSLSDGGYYFGVRFTDPNGDLWHESLADRLGVERAKVSNLFNSNGLNFAIAASRVDDLQLQVNRFASGNSWQAGDLCTLWIGGNDLRDNPNQNMTSLATDIGGIITQLANLGVDHFIIPNLPDLGAIPETQGNTTLSAERRAGTIAFNNALEAELSQRASSLPIIIERIDVFSLFDHMLLYADDFGYTNTTDALTDAPSGTPEEYTFWDDIHPTSHSHYLISSAALAIIEPSTPIEVISSYITEGLSFRQTWIGAPSATYEIRFGPALDSLSSTEHFIGKPAYTEEIPPPSPISGFFQTVKN